MNKRKTWIGVIFLFGVSAALNFIGRETFSEIVAANALVWAALAFALEDNTTEHRP